ncbi:hypothetical protein C900_00815 [Fulvivirga imtechensis AK7]|uniref:DUF4349 domain-containing protein n=1 Tax=Fulvivirga imtechensis AK7 TaxID=1237149 RepID=L8JYZ1_9BACT|nr:DUF4349 domain-containing protein [Fulvivirga imtechensis]ELR72854.1 hypothetical protein C900_00815 [Fulvivirga imtechensis AK7]
MKKILYFLFIMPVAIACNKSTEGDIAADSYDIEMMESVPEKIYAAGAAKDVRFASNPQQIERKVIKTANLNIQVANLDSAKTNIDRIVREYNAYVSADNRDNNNYRFTLNMTIRVQQDQMEKMVQKIEEQASYVHYNNINAQDVTEEFVDLNIRLKNKKAVEEQYVKLLQRANKVEDILKIENELRVIREEIEAKEGRLKYLESQVTMSTIHLTAYQDVYHVERAPAKSFLLKIGDGLSGGWDLLKNIVVGLAYIWPIWIVGGLLTFMAVKRIRRYRMKRTKVV